LAKTSVAASRRRPSPPLAALDWLGPLDENLGARLRTFTPHGAMTIMTPKASRPTRLWPLLVGVLVGMATSSREGRAAAGDGPGQTGYLPRPVGPVIQVSDDDRKGHDLMLRVLQALRERESKYNIYYGTARVDEARQLLQAATTAEDHLKMGLRLTFAEMDLGNEKAALTQMAESQRIVEQTLDRMRPDAAAELQFLFGMVNLRHGETQNCCLLHNQDSCLLPIRGGGIHTRQEGARAAIEEFKKVVQIAPRGSDRYLEAIWLWNLAAMNLAEFPDGVPAEHRMDPQRFLSQEKFPRFMNIAGELGLDMNSLCGSVVADDFNNDGYLDLMVSTWDVREPLKFYASDGVGKFVDRTSEAGLDGIAGGLNMVQGDYNNDGRVDVYILRGAWLFAAGRHPTSLLRNNGDGTFTDVTFPAGLGEESYPGQTASWADYDLDGWLDLYVGGEEAATNRAPCRLYHNNGDGTFTDVADAAGVTNHRLAKGVVWGDYNDDRYPDIYVSNLGADNRLYRNNQDGTFTDVGLEAGVANVRASFPTWFWDYDNDGVLDLFVAAFDATMAQVANYYRGNNVESGMPRVFRGAPSGVFADVTKELGLEEPTLPMGSNFGDLDNDGWLDMYLGTGSPDYKMIIPNKLYRNHAGRRFSDVSEAAGMAHLQKGHGAAFADLDADGDQDVFMQMGGAYPVDKYVDALFENPGFGNNFIAVELVGVESNRFGVGSRLRVEIEENGHTRSIYRWVNSGGSFGCNPLRQQIGVGQATKVTRLEVSWPKTGQTQSFQDLSVNHIVRVTEGVSEPVVTGLPRAAFAGAAP
jgi:hypothetical protein